jgi:hypothetical protein
MTSFDLRDIKDRTVTFVCTKAPDNSYRFLTKYWAFQKIIIKSKSMPLQI